MKLIITLVLFTFLSFFAFCQTDTIRINDSLILTQIDNGIFIHTSWHTYSFGLYPANGMVIVKNGKALIIDTPVSNEQTNHLTDYIEDSLHASLLLFVSLS